jgi:hypothetical protein
MKKLFLVLTAIVIFAAVYAADLNFDVESQFFYNNYIKNEAFQFMSLQMTPSAFDAIEKIVLKAKENFEDTKMVFNSRFYLKPEQNKFDYIIDNAYFSYENGPFVLYTGKQRIKLGTGYFWNPTDKLQPEKNLLDPTIDMEGIYAIRVEYSGDLFTPSLIIAPEIVSYDRDFLENFKFAVQLYKLIGTSDFFVNLIYHYNNLQLLGGAISYDMGVFVFNLEIAATQYIKNNNEINTSFITGLSKTLESNFFITAEYYYNGDGLTNDEFSDFISLNKISKFGLKKNYFSLNLALTYIEKFTFSLTGIYGMDDSSVFLYPKIEYIEKSNFNVEAGLIQNINARENKEIFYSMPFYNILSLKLKFYF